MGMIEDMGAVLGGLKLESANDNDAGSPEQIRDEQMHYILEGGRKIDAGVQELKGDRHPAAEKVATLKGWVQDVRASIEIHRKQFPENAAVLNELSAGLDTLEGYIATLGKDVLKEAA